MTQSEQSNIDISLMDAVAALNERKTGLPDQVDFDSAGAQVMVFGFELRVAELERLGAVVGRYTAMRVESVAEGAKAAWMDGVLSGLMLAELRSK